MMRRRTLQPFVMLGGALVLTAAVCLGFFLPVNASYAELKARATLREGIGSLNDVVAKAEQLKEARRAKERTLALWQEVLGRTPNARELLRHVNALLGRCGLTIAQFAPLPVVAGKGHGKIAQRHYQQITFETSFENLAALLRLWQELPWVARIERLQIEPMSAAGARRLNVSLHYSVYARAEQSPAGGAPREEER